MAFSATLVSGPASAGAPYYTNTTVVPGTYVVGGVPVTAAQLGLRKVKYGVAQIVTNISTATQNIGSAAVLPQADGSIKLKCNLAGGGEATAVDLSGTTVQVIAHGH